LKCIDRKLILIIGIVIVALIGYIDHLTGWYVSFTIFYLIPISLTWYSGLTYGVVIALSCGVSMIANELLWKITYPNHLTLYWNTGSKLVVFIFVAYLISTLKKQIVSLEARITDETEKRIRNERILARHARLAEMGQMIGAIAHQWRQPLSAILTTVQTVKMAWRQQEINEEYLQQTEDDVKDQIKFMSDTITSFRNFFSPDKRIETIKVHENIREVIALLSVQLANSNIKIIMADQASQDESLQVKGYRNEFKQAIINVVSNSIDAISEKNAKPAAVDGGEDTGVISISTTTHDNFIEITVEDNGCGIAPEYVDHIFEPYFTSKSNGRGTGIGLYMAKLIVVESMGGKISFETSGKGTMFRIMFPTDFSNQELLHER